MDLGTGGIGVHIRLGFSDSAVYRSRRTTRRAVILAGSLRRKREAGALDAAVALPGPREPRLGLQLSVQAYDLGTLRRPLVLRQRTDSWS
jgi:hypothetical protein